jgi:hypothetical protein
VIPQDTADLRSGAPLHDALLALLPLVGVWQGSGIGISPATGEEFRYGQHVSFVHDGRPFLAYESRSWLVAADGTVIRGAWRERGFWRPGAGADSIEVVLASNTGEALVFAGVAGDLRWELQTTTAVPTATAKRVDGEKRLYAVRDERLLYATDLAPAGREYAPHLQADLQRVPNGEAADEV